MSYPKMVRELGKRLARRELFDNLGIEESEAALVREAAKIAALFGLDRRNVTRRLRTWRDRYHATFCFV